MENERFFDTLTLKFEDLDSIIHIQKKAIEKKINLRYHHKRCTIGISLDETFNEADFNDLLDIFDCIQVIKVAYAKSYKYGLTVVTRKLQRFEEKIILAGLRHCIHKILKTVFVL